MFFYGTLRFVPLLEIVLGRPAASLDPIPAALPGHAVRWAAGQPFPMLVPEPGGIADGILVRGLSPADLARLDYYEGGFCYDLVPCRVRIAADEEVPARVYVATGGTWTPGAPWSLEDWRARWGALTLRAAEEVMSYRGRFSAQEVAAMFPAIRRRAAAWLAARARPRDPDWDVERDVIVDRHERPYAGFYATDEVTLRHRRFDGTMSDPVVRSVTLVGPAAVVLPYDPVRDQVLLIQQFRAPVLVAGDPAPWIWEPVAGLVDPGETPETTARREAEEEAGVVLDRLEPAGSAYSSTGSSSEFSHLFIGITDLSKVNGGGGLAHEGEDIRARCIGFDALIRGADCGDWRNLQLLVLANWLARNRDRLRATA